jgi:HPP family
MSFNKQRGSNSCAKSGGLPIAGPEPKRKAQIPFGRRSSLLLASGSVALLSGCADRGQSFLTPSGPVSARPGARQIVKSSGLTRLPADGRAARLMWLDLREGGILLIPPFAATLTILVYLPNTAVAQPITVVCGSVLEAAIGTLLSLVLGSGAGAALLSALAAMIMLPLLRVFHPPAAALAMCPALLHLGPWFTLEVVLPFILAAVISSAVISRLLTGLPRYPVPYSIRRD